MKFSSFDQIEKARRKQCREDGDDKVRLIRVASGKIVWRYFERRADMDEFFELVKDDPEWRGAEIIGLLIDYTDAQLKAIGSPTRKT